MNQEIFSTELLPIKDKLYRFALMFMQNHEEAEDVVQEVFMKIWDKGISLGPINNYEAYAMKMTRNFCLDKLRRSRDKNTISIDGHDKEEMNISPFVKVSFESLKDLMLKLINTLPEQQKTVMFMRDIEHYSYEEIALATGLSINNIRVSLSRARKSVRKNYLKIKMMEQFKKPNS